MQFVPQLEAFVGADFVSKNGPSENLSDLFSGILFCRLAVKRRRRHQGQHQAAENSCGDQRPAAKFTHGMPPDRMMAAATRRP
jgi:hypothetical protein